MLLHPADCLGANRPTFPASRGEDGSDYFFMTVHNEIIKNNKCEASLFMTMQEFTFGVWGLLVDASCFIQRAEGSLDNIMSTCGRSVVDH